MEKFDFEKDVLFKPLPSLEDEDCSYPGLMQRQIHYRKGDCLYEGKRSLPCDILCDSDVPVAVGDPSVTMYADVYRPLTDEKVPAIICWGYAGKRDTNNKLDNIPNPQNPIVPKDRLSGLQGWESLDPADWIPWGYAIVNADPPGVNRSEGDMLLFGSTDSQRGYDFIEWVAAQPWCNGKVAMGGNSWYAMVQLYFAAMRPPHLVCIAPFEAEADPYRDEYVRGGVPLVGKSFSIGFRCHGKNKIEDIGAMTLKYPLDTAYWKDKETHYENIKIPAYVTGSYTSWYHTRGTPEGFNRLASKEKWYRVHTSTEWIELYSDFYTNDLRRFYDYYLKDAENGWETTPRVRLGLVDPGKDSIDSRPEQTYPPERVKATAFYLDVQDGTLNAENPVEASVASYEGTDGELRFRMSFESDVEVVGPSKLKLWVSAAGADDMDLYVRFQKLDGQGQVLSSDVGLGRYFGPEGRLRVSHRELDEKKQHASLSASITRASDVSERGGGCSS